MKIQRVNDTTINCIITQQDLRESGLGLHDLFDRKKEAMDFIKGVIVEAARSQNFDLQGEYTSMHVKILADQSVSLTLSHDPAEAQSIKDICEAVQEGLKAQEEEKSCVFRFDSMRDVISFCKEVRVSRGTGSSLCADDQGGYYLFLAQEKTEGRIFTAQSLTAGEFGTFVTSDRARAGQIKEHLRTIIDRGAIEELGSL
ncbi:MAG: adaptor protein MecA [Lachnospiraceae bacterium]|nr:adaptor protein MecA [Lachnospiraceae bacterium]